jgi:hypothetical protein
VDALSPQPWLRQDGGFWEITDDYLVSEMGS